MIASYVGFAVCLVLLMSFAIALLFDFRGFREFALQPSPQGSASVGGLFTIRAGVLLLMTAAIIAGATSPLWHAGFRSETTIEPGPDDPESERRFAELKAQVKRLSSPAGVLETVESWDPAEAEAGRWLNEVRCERSGPWTPPEPAPLRASVPGTRREGIAAGCREHHNTRLQLVGVGGNGEAIDVDVRTLMFLGADCRQLAGDVDLRLSCPDAHRLFGDAVLTCDGLEPRWTRGGWEVLKVRAAEVERGCEREPAG